MRACLLLLVLAGSAAADKPEPADEAPPSLWKRKGGEDWPRFLGPRGDSTSAEKGLVVPWPKDGPRVAWHKPLGIGYSMPTVDRGRLFVFDRVRNRCRLRALNAEDGETLWTFEYATAYRDKYGYNGGPRCSPVVDGPRVYAFGPEGMLHCVNARDGKVVWKVDTEKEFGVIQNFFGVGSTPVVEGDLLLVQVGGSPKGSDETPFDELKANGTGMVAFDKRTGKVKWKALDELASYSSPVLATVGKRRLCLLLGRGGLHALDPRTGKAEGSFPWRANMLESVNASNPVVVGERVLISECYQIGAAWLDIKPGGGFKPLWTDKEKGRRKRLATHWMTPVVVDGYAYGSSGRHENEAELRCVELATGTVMWSEKGLTRTSLLHVDGHFVCLGEDGTLLLLKAGPKKY
ncbi:MAG: PQQ-like beta-propeller repeat protein, partial [Gemmataceae bacterium]|nr:PQQ-like beta-propeller repeat protein [Gemmataceae bacterium]